MKYNYWKVEYKSCEGNYRWTIARAPEHWEEMEVFNSCPRGGCGDDPAQIISVEESYDEDYSWDLTYDGDIF